MKPIRPSIRICLTGSLVGLGVSLLFCLDLNGLTLGEEEASGPGIPIERSKKFACSSPPPFSRAYVLSAAGIDHAFGRPDRSPFHAH
ncbi:MAG: hypothetical protein U5K27_02105 [Desulfotignum sp.]|nr:hypothetical protein [Desulfotignum sp.]